VEYFGIIPKNKLDKNDLKTLALLSRERGKDSSGFFNYDKDNNSYSIKKFDKDIKMSLIKFYQILPI
jgi:uncharacterized protein YfeS